MTFTWTDIIRKKIGTIEESMMFSHVRTERPYFLRCFVTWNIRHNHLFFPQYIGILFRKLFWPSLIKICSADWEKYLKIRSWRRRICKILETTRTIYSNSERSKQNLKQNTFLIFWGGHKILKNHPFYFDFTNFVAFS